jgi:hypothetical protein
LDGGPDVELVSGPEGGVELGCGVVLAGGFVLEGGVELEGEVELDGGEELGWLFCPFAAGAEYASTRKPATSAPAGVSLMRSKFAIPTTFVSASSHQ